MGHLKKRGINYVGMANWLMVQETVLPATQLDTFPRFPYLSKTNIVTVTQRENKNIFFWIPNIKFYDGSPAKTLKCNKNMKHKKKVIPSFSLPLDIEHLGTF